MKYYWRVFVCFWLGCDLEFDEPAHCVRCDRWTDTGQRKDPDCGCTHWTPEHVKHAQERAAPIIEMMLGDAAPPQHIDTIGEG